MDFGVRPRGKTPKSGVAHCKLSPSQENENEQIQNQIDALFLLLLILLILIILILLILLIQGIVHKVVPPGKTVNQTFYREVLEGLRKKVARVRPGIARTWKLHHDNAPCCTAVSNNEFLAEKSIYVVPQPPCSPDLSLCDLFLLSGSKITRKGAILVLGIISRRA